MPAPAPYSLPTLAPLHRERWARVGRSLARVHVAPALPGRSAESAPAPTPVAAIERNEIGPRPLPGLVPAALPVPIFAVDAKRERAGDFFMRLLWLRVGLDAPERSAVTAPELMPTVAPRTEARDFFAARVPWAARETEPTESTRHDFAAAALDLKSLLTAATEQAVHTSRKRQAGRPVPLFPAAPADRGAATFFQTLDWTRPRATPLL